ncbi:hypothetical protein HA052_26740 [Chromobacterium haemolyticum]|uniref:Uncharacterized protein n=1 Tax=Chromobacterium fluminis TaxID=3044269 RepID=A0ABX0LJY2_9NEIS|nr:hypothetical protein [Chromobacterium haemolyticum]NHR08790.1 hypothetical protein [Chromobacterium haemolyticum]
MQFVVDNGIYKVARVTGPQHNLLGIRLSDCDEEMKAFPLKFKSGEKVRVSEADVLSQVKSGLALANQVLSKKYFISEVYFLPSDTCVPGVYELLVGELIRRIDHGGHFLMA